MFIYVKNDHELSIMKYKYTLANQLYSRLLQQGEIVCDSPVVRAIIYDKLRKGGLEFTSETVDDTGGTKCLNPYAYGGIGYEPGRLIKWVTQGRIYKQDLLNVYDQGSYRYPKSYIDELYSDTSTHDRKYEILCEMSEALSKYTIFDWVPLRKLIKKIKLKHL